MIAVSGLTKTFGGTRALDPIDLSIERGESVALAGPRGSGRSVLLRLLATLERPTSGTIRIDGLDAVRDMDRVRGRIGYASADAAGADAAAFAELSAGEFLRFVMSARGVPTQSAAAILARLEIDPHAPAGRLPAGLRQRLSVAAALAGAPVVALLDDPFRGMDARGRELLGEWLRERREAGTTLLIAPALETEADALYSRIVRLESGRVAGNPA